MRIVPKVGWVKRACIPEAGRVNVHRAKNEDVVSTVMGPRRPNIPSVSPGRELLGLCRLVGSRIFIHPLIESIVRSTTFHWFADTTQPTKKK